MTEPTPLKIGLKVSCADGICDRLTRVVVDPIADAVTHLVVEPEHRQGLGRLVPIESVEASAEQVALSCTRDQFDRLPEAEEVRFLRGVGSYSGYDPGDILLWPYFGGNTAMPVVIDELPLGKVGVERGEKVYAIDGQIGQVEGLVINSSNHHVTHVLLEEGHLFGRKHAAIPITAVKSVSSEGVDLSLTKQQAQDLPAVEFRHPNSKHASQPQAD